MKLVAKERLMLAHTTIFAVFLILFTIREVLAYIGYFDETLQEEYRVTKAYVVVKVASAITDICMVTLLSHITLEMRKPLPVFWQQILIKRLT